MAETPAPARHAGHNAQAPTQLGRKGLWSAAKRVATRVPRDMIGLVAAGVAFFALLALFPSIAALVAIAGLVLDSTSIVAQLEQSTTALPPAAREILLSQVRAVAADGTVGLNLAAVGGLALAIFSSSRGVANLIAGLNVAYEEEEKRNIFKLTGVTVVLTLFLFVALSVVLVIVAILPALVSVLGSSPARQMVLEVLRWPVVLLVGSLTFSALYRFGPSRRAARWRWLAPGGTLACLTWVVATAGFGWYVETLGRYSETFGALAGVIILLLWLWLSAFAVLVGAVVDAELEHQTARDSTVGPERPMGIRGAVKADTFPPDG